MIAQGISEEGGLFVPETLPDLRAELPELLTMDYRSMAKRIFSFFLTDFTAEEIDDCVEKAYSEEKFEGKEPVRLVPLVNGEERKYLLELWHGPTCAFKDMALQILPRFLTKALEKAAPGKSAVILTATSGDTGKAALEGFKNVPGTEILVFYPRDGVSPMQKLQMTSQEGENVRVCAVEGNFDDAQTAVKQIFTDPAVKRKLECCGKIFSSANSINWGRLLPQIVYYFYAYARLCASGEVKPGNKINITVPTGNFGNILAAFYASVMGLPVKKLICASNSNCVLTDFIRTGVYDRRREFYATSSPSMDILISSNLERLLYALSGEDSKTLSGWMNELSQNGFYRVSEDVGQKVHRLFYGGFCSEEETAQTVRQLFRQENYLCDTHTAVGVQVCRQYIRETGDTDTPMVIASTASPYKFTRSVLLAIGEEVPDDEFLAMRKLEQASGTGAQRQLWELQNKKVRFDRCIPKEKAGEFVFQLIEASEG